ncbi:receptor Serine/Threonine like protein [Perilla frutescens var. hirtella]|uniref:Receptor Serine/Threonine like protein n=1 Tax=Perilla frutescens var. hirtella TaxID=608512 RepID=A0AAD4NVV3_PERFH|nr:receptor Serine/Threonine like protein [Perilla frutescens var. hirtella]
MIISCAVPPPSECSFDPFDCGNLRHIAYPFWGRNRTSECGRKGFEIICNDDVPTLNISSLSYRVEELDFSTNTLTVSRRDSLYTMCYSMKHNTTIDLELFNYPPDSTYRNVTLYFDCSGDHAAMLPNNFTCPDETINLFKINGDDASSSPGPGTGIRCKSNIHVPINSKHAEFLHNHPSEDSLKSALGSGFSIQWSGDSKQSTSPFCNSEIYASCAQPLLNYYYNRRRRTAERRISNRDLAPRSDVVAASVPIRILPVPSRFPSPAYAPESRPAKYEGPAPASSTGGNVLGSPKTSQMEYGLAPVPTPSAGGNVLGSPNAYEHGKKRAKLIVIVVILCVAGMILVSISTLYLLTRRRRLLATSPKPEPKHDVVKFLLQNGSLTPKRYTYSQIKKMTKSLGDKLGQGGYGSVYKGTLPDGCPVAVKILIETGYSNGEEFINEVASISRTSHVNIVTLLGFCYEGNKRALVYEFMPNSSLDKFLNNNHQSSDCRLDLEKLYKIAVGIAKGLEYLHTGCNTRIVHFDIKPQNILLDDDFCPKISDFGLAKLCKKQQSVLSVVGTRGTAGYIAPEVFSRTFGGVSHKSDVYSYGMMVLEMAGAREIVENEAIQSSENYFPDKIYEQVVMEVDEDHMMMEETRRKMMVVGFWCIQTIPSSRPSMSKVVEMLERSLQSMEVPPKPFLFCPNLPQHEISSSLSECVESLEIQISAAG